MQLQGQLGQGRSPYPSVLSALWRIGRAEGLSGLQRGLVPSCFWQFSNVSVRFGVYSTAKRLVSVEDQSPLRKWAQSVGLAGVSGGLAALASNPFFIIKTRFQSMSTDAALAVGQQHATSGGVGGALGAIVRSDGPAGLFRGLSAFAPRVIVASAVQLSTCASPRAHAARREGGAVGRPPSEAPARARRRPPAPPAVPAASARLPRAQVRCRQGAVGPPPPPRRLLTVGTAGGRPPATTASSEGGARSQAALQTREGS